VSNKLDKFILKLKPEMWLALKISFGIFLFILFFQPLPLEGSDINKVLPSASGFGFILFFSIIIGRILSSLLFDTYLKNNEDAIFPEYFNGTVIFLLSAAAFSIYAHFAAGVNLTLTIAFRIFIICLIPPLIIGLHDSFYSLKKRNEELIHEKKVVQNQIEKYEEDILNKSVEFASENSNDKLNLTVSEVVYFKSSDNYVEIAYTESGGLKKKLIRNTLKNIESQIKQYSIFLRCHRTCIINLHFIDKLHKSSGNHWLSIKGSDEKLPVSRQYLLMLQEAL
jgi:DNA-binding LytR/AlgR family response regulator